MEGTDCKTTRLSTTFPTIMLSCAFLHLTGHPDQPPKTIRSQVGTWSYNQPELSCFHTTEGLTYPPAPAASSEQLCPLEVPEEARNWCGQRAGPAYPCSLSGWRFPYGCKIVTLASPHSPGQPTQPMPPSISQTTGRHSGCISMSSAQHRDEIGRRAPLSEHTPTVSVNQALPTAMPQFIRS